MEILDQNDFSYKKIVPEEEKGFLTNLMITISGGKISSKKQANGLLLFLAIICILGTFYIIVINPILNGPGAGIEAAASHHQPKK